MKPLLQLGFTVLAACGTGGTGPDDPLDPAALNILFVGNSLTSTNDLPGMVVALIDSADLGPVTAVSVAYPDFGLEDHWLQGTARQQLRRQGWDVVVMQQGPSATEGRPSLLEYAERFAEPIRAAQAVPALFMVWPSSDRPFDWDGVRDSYQMAATRVGGVFLPAGEAWRAAWARDATLALYGGDGFHPSPLGTYLAALVIAERLTGRSAVGLPRELRTRAGVGISVSAATALLVQQAVHEVVQRYHSGTAQHPNSVTHDGPAREGGRSSHQAGHSSLATPVQLACSWAVAQGGTRATRPGPAGAAPDGSRPRPARAGAIMPCDAAASRPGPSS